MKLIKPSTELISWADNDPLQVIERIGRTCYKSEDKITETSAPAFVQRIIKQGHLAVLDHWNLVFSVTPSIATLVEKCLTNVFDSMWCSRYFRITRDTRCLVSTNMRSVIELAHSGHEMLGKIFVGHLKEFYPDVFVDIDVPQSLSVPVRDILLLKTAAKLTAFEQMIHEVVSVRFIIDRGVSHELVRHRPVAYCQESTRYCNYGNQEHMTFIIPPWMINVSPMIHKTGDSTPYLLIDEARWFWHMKDCEHKYRQFLELGWSPQKARSVLPNSLKTEVVATATMQEWKHIFSQRCAKNAHPQMQEVMIPLRDKFQVLYPKFLSGSVNTGKKTDDLR